MMNDCFHRKLRNGAVNTLAFFIVHSAVKSVTYGILEQKLVGNLVNRRSMSSQQ